jgi:hypothetical protein
MLGRPCGAAYSNRAACHTHLGAFAAVIEDAERCIALEPAWGKGYTRKGYVEMLTKKYAQARPNQLRKYSRELFGIMTLLLSCHRDTVDFIITGSRAKAWCLLIHAEASLSLSLWRRLYLSHYGGVDDIHRIEY